MNLEHLSDDALIDHTHRYVRIESKALTRILDCFEEIQRRRLFAQFKYKNLAAMAIGHFKYSADQAYRRVDAMRLRREIPEIQEKIETGALTLSHLASAEILFKQEAKRDHEMPREAKLQLLEEISSKSSREAEKIIASHSSSPKTLKPDQVRYVTGEDVEMKFLANASVIKKIEKLRGLIAHTHPGISLGELFELLCDQAIENWQKPHRRPSGAAKEKRRETKAEAETGAEIDAEINAQTGAEIEAEAGAETGGSSSIHEARRKINAGLSAPNFLDSERNQMELSDLEVGSISITRPACREQVRPAIRAAIRREIFARARGKCENCGSEHALQLDHIIPHARGGSSEVDNLRLLCRNCNQRAAIHEFGQSKMDECLRQEQAVWTL